MAGGLSEDEIIRYLDGVLSGDAGQPQPVTPRDENAERLARVERAIEELRDEIGRLRDMLRGEAGESPAKTEGSEVYEREARREDRRDEGDGPRGRRQGREPPDVQEREKRSEKGPRDYEAPDILEKAGREVAGADDDAVKGIEKRIADLEDNLDDARAAAESAKERVEERARGIERQTGETRQRAELAHHEAREARREVKEIRLARNAKPEDVQKAFLQHQQAVQRQLDGFRASLARTEDSVRRIPELVKREAERINENINRNLRASFEVQQRQVWGVLDRVQAQVNMLQQALANTDARVMHMMNRYNAEVLPLKNSINNFAAELKFVEDRIRRVEEEARRGFR